MTRPAIPDTRRTSRDHWWLWASAPIAVQAGVWAGRGAVAVVAAGTVAWLFLARHRGRRRVAVLEALLVWVAVLSLSVILAVEIDPSRAAAAIPHGTAYWDEMRPWLETGSGRESTPSLFVPEHLLHLAAFTGLSAATAGWAGLVLGCYLLSYMSFYVAQVMMRAQHPLLAGLLAWHPWSVARVVSFVMLGVSCSRLMLDRLGPRRWWAAERGSLALAGLLWIVDLVLKMALAPSWPRLIRSVM